MSKKDVLGALAALTGGLLSVGKGAILGVALVAVGAYVFAATRTRPTRDNLTAVVGNLAN
ncbi:hypothetical protein [Halorussus caseinilyticus]|uniref:Uncharacterized protein n=1 Tax=Halorussus caseinilyticus TaxID=3034025 RepID=A0ABD5WMH8_9EURY|nr:hypothetical protein [Halorussus sp. DT72]